MGRFYKTSTPTFVDDKMFQLPYELMGKVLEKKEAGIQSDIDTTTALADTLTAQGLEVDTGRIQEKIGGYQSRIDEQIQSIKGNVLNYDPTGIQKLKRDITTDWTTGEISAIEKQKASHLADLANWKALAKSDPEKYTQPYLDKLAAESLAKYKGINYKSPTEHGTYRGLSATAMPDVNKWVEEKLKGAMSDITSVKRVGDEGGWRVTRGTETEVMSEEALNSILDGALKADPAMTAALKQRRDFQMEGFGGLFGEDDELLNPVVFGTDKETGRRGMGYQSNILGNAFKAGLEKYGFSKVKKSIVSQLDSYKFADYAQAIKKKEEADEFVTMTDKGYVVPYGGNGQAAFLAQRATGIKRMKEIQEQGMTLALNKFNYATEEEFKNDPKRAEIYKKVKAGDYVGAGLTEEVSENLTKQHKELRFEQNVRNNLVTEFRKKHAMPDVNDKNAVGKDAQKFDTWLAARDNVEVDVVKGWGYLPDFTAKKQQQFIKGIEDAGLIESGTLVIPEGGLQVTDKNNKVIDLSGYASINDMIDAGIAQVKQEKTGVVTEEPVYMINPKTGETMPYVSGTVKVIELMDGTVIGNLTIPANSVVPVFGASDSGKVQLEATLNLGGKTVKTIVSDVSSTSIDKYNEENAAMLAGRKKIAKIGYGSADISPNQDGSMIYHGERKGQGRAGVADEDETKTYKKGWVEIREGDSYDTYDMTNPHVEREIYRRIFE